MILKSCPVVFHPDGAPLRHLIFEHPDAGHQLVKGTVEAGENPVRAAARELFEEAGLETFAATQIGESSEIQAGEIWHFALCRIRPDVRSAWQHFTRDDGGKLFRFRWLDLSADRPEMDARYIRALDWITQKIG